jgi:hypothetical protein
MGLPTQIYHQRGEFIMPQQLLPYQYIERSSIGMTAMSGLPTYLDLAQVARLSESVRSYVRVRPGGGQGWSDEEMVRALVLLKLAGGDCVADINVLEGDEGLCRVMRKAEWHGLSRRERRERERRFRKENKRSFPSESAIFRYLSCFHEESQEANRQPGTAFIPEPNAHLRGLLRVSQELVSFQQRRSPSRQATLDMDATLIESTKKQALFSYKGYRAYQPLTTYWFEQDVIVHSEFRDGNVPAGHEQLRVFQESLAALPEGVEEVLLRSDSAGYQKELLRFCAEGRSERFGVIGFAIGADVTEALRKSVTEVEESQWHSLSGGHQQWAEICFVPGWAGHSKKNPDYRFIAIREPLRQPTLTGIEQSELPFPVMEMKSASYKLTALVTNRDLSGEELIAWYRQRCGNSEQAHAIVKDDLGGAGLPSASFGENAAWWALTVLAFNLNTLMKRLVLGGSWVNKRLKAIRFHFINIAGRVWEHARTLWIGVSQSHPSWELLRRARQSIALLAQPSG